MDVDEVLWTVNSATQLTGVDSRSGNITTLCPSLTAAGEKGFHPQGSPGPVLAADGVILVPEATGGIFAVGSLKTFYY